MSHDLDLCWTAYMYLRGWEVDGTWKVIRDTLFAADRERAERDPEPSPGIIGSQTVRTTEKGVIEDTTEPGGRSGVSVTSSPILKAA